MILDILQLHNKMSESEADEIMGEDGAAGDVALIVFAFTPDGFVDERALAAAVARAAYTYGVKVGRRANPQMMSITSFSPHIEAMMERAMLSHGTSDD